MFEQKIKKYLRSTVFYDEKKEKYEAIASPSLDYKTPTKTKTIFNASDLLYLAKREEKEKNGELFIWIESEFVERDEEKIYILRGILSNLNCRAVINFDERDNLEITRKKNKIFFEIWGFSFNEDDILEGDFASEVSRKSFFEKYELFYEDFKILFKILDGIKFKNHLKINLNDEKNEITVEFGTHILFFSEQNVKIKDDKNEKILLKKPVKRNPKKKEFKIDEKDFENFITEFLEVEIK